LKIAEIVQDGKNQAEKNQITREGNLHKHQQATAKMWTQGFGNKQGFSGGA
jgi:hypothetical protein